MERTGWSGMERSPKERIPKHFSNPDLPDCATAVASLLFIDGAATPPVSGGELPASHSFTHSMTARISLILGRKMRGIVKRCILAAICVIVASLLVLGQSSNGSLATLIQKGDRKATLKKIRAGADVNEAQPDGTHPIHWAVFKVDYELL